ncbi:hypothetical protein AB8O38_22150, partial [Saccharomonospora xinjiangensis]|uniref:hypothetical protein n=1 Tax=Saccharomonospora xinjiangensis TaxID=75294 RepID=UPI00350F3A7A
GRRDHRDPAGTPGRVLVHPMWIVRRTRYRLRGDAPRVGARGDPPAGLFVPVRLVSTRRCVARAFSGHSRAVAYDGEEAV